MPMRLTYTAADHWPWPLAFFWNFGPRGVDLFFVLSGFLVSGLIFREHQRSGQFHALHFLVRRGLKIYPAFYLMMLMSLLAGIATGYFPHLRNANWAAEALFVQNYFPGVWGHTWSLAVEEHFYILLSVMLYFILRNHKIGERPLQAVGLAAVVGALCLAFRFQAFATMDVVRWQATELPSHMRIDSLLFGVLLSYFYHYHSKATMDAVQRYRWLITMWLLLAVTLWAILPRTLPIMGTIGLSTLSIAFGGLILLAVTSEIKLRKPFDTVYSGFCCVGEYSYSIYLWHWPVMIITGSALRHLLGRETAPPTLCYAVYAVGSVVIGVTMAKLVEVPVLRLRDRWFPSRSGSLH
jgi:peptidoglycan/LPS O-acetylase OafA/YrhL